MNSTGTLVSSLIAEQLVPAGDLWSRRGGEVDRNSNRAYGHIRRGTLRQLVRLSECFQPAPFLRPTYSCPVSNSHSHQFAQGCIPLGVDPCQLKTGRNYSTIFQTWIFLCRHNLGIVEGFFCSIVPWRCAKRLIPLIAPLLLHGRALKFVAESIRALGIHSFWFFRHLSYLPKTLFPSRNRIGITKMSLAFLESKLVCLQSKADLKEQSICRILFH